MAAGDINPVYVTPTSGSGGLTSLATSSDFTAGYEWFLVDVAGMSPIPRDVRHSGKIRVGTTPTANTEIRIYLVASNDGSTWPDVFDGTGSAETVTSSGIRDSVCKLAAVMATDATSDRVNWFGPVSVASLFGGMVPKKFVVFVTHNTGVNLNATGGNHAIYVTPATQQIV